MERGFIESFALPLVLLAIAGGLAVLGGTAIATGLSLADARPDLATMAAVGASARTRRRIAMAQAAVVSFLGSGLRLLAGLVPGIAMSWPDGDVRGSRQARGRHRAGGQLPLPRHPLGPAGRGRRRRTAHRRRRRRVAWVLAVRARAPGQRAAARRTRAPARLAGAARELADAGAGWPDERVDQQPQQQPE